MRFVLSVILLLPALAVPISTAVWAQEPEPKAVSPADQIATPPANEPAAPLGEEHHAPADAPHQEHLGKNLPLPTVIPFVTLLLCIAILPLAAGHWWEHNSNKGIIVAILSVIVTAYMLTHGAHGLHEILDKIHEYISFIILLAALYIISGGIYVKGSLSGTPLANTALMAIGAGLASIIGTTGASVLLIRPLLRANKTRVDKAHIVVFFIFIVSNCGGLLTPLGDPPLFLGFLKGVPFLWTLEHLWPQWLLVNIALLIIFNVYDQLVLGHEERERPGSQLEEVMEHEPLRIEGQLNFLFLAGIVVTIFCAGQYHWAHGVQEIIMLALSLLAYFTTPASNRIANKFTFGPIIEVAVLFIGIFITMAPALQILNAWGQGLRPDLGAFFMDDTWEYFWGSGILSSFLDNAPTYLTFAATAAGKEGVPLGSDDVLAQFLAKGPAAAALLAAISCGSVFMGANTYIGNGPNFMVKAIAEENGVQMPSFFGYMAYSGLILIPIFIVVTIAFFRS